MWKKSTVGYNPHTEWLLTSYMLQISWLGTTPLKLDLVPKNHMVALPKDKRLPPTSTPDTQQGAEVPGRPPDRPRDRIPASTMANMDNLRTSRTGQQLPSKIALDSSWISPRPSNIWGDKLKTVTFFRPLTFQGAEWTMDYLTILVMLDRLTLVYLVYLTLWYISIKGYLFTVKFSSRHSIFMQIVCAYHHFCTTEVDATAPPCLAQTHTNLTSCFFSVFTSWQDGHC